MFGAQRRATMSTKRTFKKILAAKCVYHDIFLCCYCIIYLLCSRGEIAIRIMRAGAELNIRTTGIYAYEDRYCPHRYKADESYLVGTGKSAVGAYLDIPGILQGELAPHQLDVCFIVSPSCVYLGTKQPQQVIELFFTAYAVAKDKGVDSIHPG